MNTVSLIGRLHREFDAVMAGLQDSHACEEGASWAAPGCGACEGHT